MPTKLSVSGARLPAPFRYPILGSRAAPLILRPWFDRLALPAISRWYFPLSRAWAAALASGGAPERFLAEAYGPETDCRLYLTLAGRFLGALETRRRLYERAEQTWQEAYFGPEAPGAAALVTAQNDRQEAAQRFMAARAGALPLHLVRRFQGLRFEIAPPDAVEAAHGARLADPESAFAPPAPSEIAESRRVPAVHGEDHWLRFASPLLGDSAWARVSIPEPWAEAGTPSLIFLHGIAMETEFWRGMIDPSLPLLKHGIRLIRPEGPWHGRRRPEGWFGGENVMARGPLGFIELFQAWVAEVAVLIAWARRTGKGPVAVGGVSLGALAAQMVAAAARHWPAELRPDALFLVATSGDIVDVAERGSLSRALGLPARLRAAGWSPEELTRWAPLLQPSGRPGVDPARIVMVLGQADDLLPYQTGLDLARRWGVPPDNLFQRPQGHFSVSLGLEAAPEPLIRLARLLGAG